MDNYGSEHLQLEPLVRLCEILTNSGVASSLFYNNCQLAGSDPEIECCNLWQQCANIEPEPLLQAHHCDYKSDFALVANSLCPYSHPIAIFSPFENVEIRVCTGSISRAEKTNNQPEEGESVAIPLNCQPATISLRIIDDMVSWFSELSRQSQQSNHEKEQLASALEKSFEEISLLHKIGDIICPSQKPVDYICKIATDLLSVIECENIVIFWNNFEDYANSNSLSPAVYQDENKAISSANIEILWNIARNVIAEKANFKIDNNFRCISPYVTDDICNYIVTPIQGKEVPVGAIVAVNKNCEQGFGTVEARMMLSIANKLSNSHETQTLYLGQQELMMGTLRALVRSIDAKDPYTCGHSERVAIISKFLASEMKLSDQEIENGYMAGLLHDIGKIGIRGTTLRKDARLTNEEFEEIKKHPKIGAGILKGIRQIAIVVNGVLTHHERYDGKGYPMGLSGSNIPIIGRIVNIADTIDAMISSRPYRRSLPISKVLYEISRFSGTQFDPKIADVLLKSDINTLINMLNNTDISAHDDNALSGNRTSEMKIPDISKQLSGIKYSDYANCDFQLI